MPLLMQVYGLEDEPIAELLFDTLTADAWGKNPGDLATVGDDPFVVMDVKRGVVEERWDHPIDLAIVKRKANQ